MYIVRGYSRACFICNDLCFRAVHNSSFRTTVSIRIIKLIHFDKSKMVSFKRNIILFAIMSLMFDNVANITQRTICNYNIIRYTNTFAIITFILRFTFIIFICLIPYAKRTFGMLRIKCMIAYLLLIYNIYYKI